MKIKLFDQKEGKLIPTKHLERMNTFQEVRDYYGPNWEEVVLWAHYMTYPYPQENPYINVSELERSEFIQSKLDMSVDVDLDEYPEELKSDFEKIYSTPISRSYKGIAAMLDKMSDYIDKTEVKDGRDGNMAQLTQYAKSYKQIRESFKLAQKDLEEESTKASTGRGGVNLAYDQ